MDTLLSTNISRRTLAKGATWAAPAVVATAAVPAYAASSVEPTYNYEPSASWTSETTWKNASDYSCPSGEGVLQTLNFHTVANPNVPDYSGWGVRPVDGAPPLTQPSSTPSTFTWLTPPAWHSPSH